MYAYIDSFRKFGKTNTDNQSIKIKRPYPAGKLFFRFHWSGSACSQARKALPAQHVRRICSPESGNHANRRHEGKIPVVPALCPSESLPTKPFQSLLAASQGRGAAGGGSDSARAAPCIEPDSGLPSSLKFRPIDASPGPLPHLLAPPAPPSADPQAFPADTPHRQGIKKGRRLPSAALGSGSLPLQEVTPCLPSWRQPPWRSSEQPGRRCHPASSSRPKR